MKKTSKRIAWIDIAKGIGILIMIMGHVGFGGKFDRIIHSCHMPLFFILSGFLYTKKNSSLFKQILHKGKSLLIPYVCFFFINYGFWLLLKRKGSLLSPILTALTFNTHGMPIAGALWFLTALFFTEIGYLCFDTYLKKETVKNAILLILGICVAILTTFTQFKLPLALDISISSMPFFIFGIYLKKWMDSEHLNILYGIGLLLLNVLLSFINGYVNIKEGWYAFYPLTLLNAIVGSLAIINISLFLEKKGFRIKQVFIEMGKHSIVFLCLNQLLIEILSRFIPTMGIQGQIQPLLLAGSLLTTLSTTGILFTISHFLMKSKWKWICGK